MTTKVVVKKDKGFITGFEIRGHSGYAPSGRDIVCSSVTTLVQVLNTGLIDILGIRALSVADKEKALVSINWEDNSQEAQAIGKTVSEVFRSLAEAYPKNVKYSEVQIDAL